MIQLTDADHKTLEEAGLGDWGIDFGNVPDELAERLLDTMREYLKEQEKGPDG